LLLKSDTVHNAWAATQRTVGIKLTIKETEYDASDITSMTFDSGAMNGEALALGSTYQNTIKVVFSNLIEGLALTDEITPELGIKLPDGTWDYTPLGVFVIDAEVQQDRNNNTTTVSASDRMCMLGGTYESKLTYPAAINDIAVEIANLAAVKLSKDDFARLPTDKVASFGKVTYRDAIGFVAQFAGGFATFDRKGLLDIRQLVDPNFDVAPSQYQSKGLTKNEALYRIGGITCTVTTTTTDDSGNETQDTTTLQSGSTAGTQITISNPGMTQDLLDGLYEQLQDLNFYPFSLSWFGDPNLEAGDWIEVQDTAGNTFKTPNLLYSLTFSGGVTATSKADTTVSASASFVYKGQLNQIVENIRQYLNASGQQVSEGLDEPPHPKAGDVWFKKSGPDTYIMMYKVDPETGIGSWVEEVSTKGVSGLDAELKAAKAKLNADILAAQANLTTAQKDVAALQTKLAANDATQAQLSKDLSANSDLMTQVQADLATNTKDLTALDAKLKTNDDIQAQLQTDLATNTAIQAQLTTDLAANSQLVTQNKADVDAALVTVNETLTQAQADTETAVKNADLAVANAQSAIDASGLATQTANAASDAAIAAKTLANSTATSFATVQSQATSAMGDAANALAQAQSALASAGTAQSNAAKATAMYDELSGTFTAQIQTVQNGLDNLEVGGTNLLSASEDNVTLGKFYDWATGTGSSGSSPNRAIFIGYIPVVSGERYTVSADWSKASNIQVFGYANTSDVATRIFGNVGNIEKAWTTPSVIEHIITSTSTVVISDGVNYLRIGVTNFNGKSSVTYQDVVDAKIKVERGSMATDWSPCPEDIQSQITTNTLNISANSKAITLAAKQTTVDTLNQQVQTNTAQLQLTATVAELKLATQSVETLTGRVTTAEGTIKATNDKLTQIYTKTETDGLLAPLATQTWTQTQVTSAADQWGVRISKIQSAIDGITTGGTNLLSVRPDTVQLASTLRWRSGEVVSATVERSAINYYVPVIPGEQYTISANWSIPMSGILVFGYATTTNFASWILDDKTGWVVPSNVGYLIHDTMSMTIPDGVNYLRLGVNLANSSTVISYQDVVDTKMKVEKGSTATGWNPAPENITAHTDLAVANLELAVDSLSSTFAKQTDLQTVSTKTNATADGLDAVIAVTGPKAEKVTTLLANVDAIQSTMTGTNGYSTRLQTLEGFQQTATTQLADKATTAQLTQVSGLLSSTVTQVNKIRGENLLRVDIDTVLLASTLRWRSGEVVSATVERSAINYYVPVIPGEQYTISANWSIPIPDILVFGYATTTNFASWILDDKTGWVVPSSVGHSIHDTMSMTVPDGVNYLRFGVNLKDKTVAILYQDVVDTKLKVEYGDTATPWTPAFTDTAMGTSITQLQNDVDIRVSVSNRIAAALSLSADGGGTAVLAANHVHITGATSIDNASISSAAIASLDATKITSGSISADRLATTELNADNITSGSIASARIASTAINANNITSGSIAAARISTTALSATNITSGTFDASKMTVKNIDAGSITTGSIATALLASTKINADNITSGSIAAARIATTALSATNIVSGTLDVSKLTVENLSADLIATGTIDASKITVENLSASNIVAGTFDGSKMTVKNIDASSINTGTLNAAGLNVIGLNANAITTGTIKGANLAINLNSGEVLFTKGSIKSIDGHLNIDVNDGTLAQTDGLGNGFVLKDGGIRFSKQATYFSDAAPDYGELNYATTLLNSVPGVWLKGKQAAVISTPNFGSLDVFIPMFSSANAGSMVGASMQGSIMASTAQGAIIAGNKYTENYIDRKPRITVGTVSAEEKGQGFRAGDSTDTVGSDIGIIGQKVVLNGYGPNDHIADLALTSDGAGGIVRSYAIYNRTYSSGTNLTITEYGTIGRVTSATKYKTMIERSRSTDIAETLLTLPTAHWYDKAEMSRYANGDQTQAPKMNFGMIAEDLASAGLEELVIRDHNGELEGINYDRIAPALLPLLAKMKQEIEELKSAAKSA
jgi:hypothetical protein